MAAARTKFAVGLFILVGSLLGVASIIWVGYSGFLESGRHYVIYFDESVQGLDVDSPVKYRGVNIGRVKSIKVAPDGRLVEIIIVTREELKEKDLLVAQLKSVGITGIMFIELDLAETKKSREPLKLSFEAPYPAIPSQSSDIQQIFSGLEMVFGKFRDMDFEGITSRLEASLDNLNQVLSEADVAAVVSRAVTALDRINRIVEPGQWEKIMASVREAATDIQQGAAEAREMMDDAETAVEELSAILEENRQAVKKAVLDLQEAMAGFSRFSEQGQRFLSGAEGGMDELRANAVDAAQNLERATAKLNRILEQVEKNPGGLLFSAPPEPRKTP
ncbi:MAG: MCE family protein [Deltaproteobacteria bacterium]|nr:MCE family protein [Deltaproteobacteria bacterium]